MTGFELQISGIGGKSSTNCATTTDQDTFLSMACLRDRGKSHLGNKLI